MIIMMNGEMVMKINFMHKDYHYVYYLTDLENIMCLLKNGKITGTFEYINKNGNKGIRYIK